MQICKYANVLMADAAVGDDIPRWRGQGVECPKSSPYPLRRGKFSLVSDCKTARLHDLLTTQLQNCITA
jgi:hypothetical protein